MKDGHYDCLSENTVEQLMFLVITVIYPHRWSGVSGVFNSLGLEMRDQDSTTRPRPRPRH